MKRKLDGTFWAAMVGGLAFSVGWMAVLRRLAHRHVQSPRAKAVYKNHTPVHERSLPPDSRRARATRRTAARPADHGAARRDGRVWNLRVRHARLPDRPGATVLPRRPLPAAMSHPAVRPGGPNSKRRIYCVVLPAFCAFAGCVSIAGVTNAGVVQAGAGTFMVAKQAPNGLEAPATLKDDAIAEAGQFCTRKGKDIQVLSAMEQPPPVRNSLRVEVQFRCVEAAPADSRPASQHR
jgi:hypothetical protein